MAAMTRSGISGEGRIRRTDTIPARGESPAVLGAPTVKTLALAQWFQKWMYAAPAQKPFSKGAAAYRLLSERILTKSQVPSRLPNQSTC